MIPPVPCSHREPNTNDGIGGLEEQQCPNGQIFRWVRSTSNSPHQRVTTLGGGGNRTPVPRSRLGSISGRSRRFGSQRCRAHRRARQLPAR